MCEVLPRIDESRSPSPNGENSKLEQLMISMLEERDKLVDKLRESQEVYNETTKKLSQVEADNGILMRQLQAMLPDDEEPLLTLLDDLRANGGVTNGSSDDFNKWPVARSFAQLARELAMANERVAEKEEEVGELKSERSNTRLLLEHLECLVARHERSLRMTVIKRQTSNAGVSSEVEVLKALKSLFDHHKALDEKVRERLRTAQERIVLLEDELMLSHQEMKTLKDSNKRMKRLIQQRNSVRMSMIGYDSISFTKEQLAMLEERDQTIGDLQFSIDERTAQLEEVIAQREEMSEKIQELEEELTMALSELMKYKESNKHFKETLSEQKKLQSQVGMLQLKLSDRDERISTTSESNEHLSNQMETVREELEELRNETSTLRIELSQKSHALNQAVSFNEDVLQRKTHELSMAEEERGSAEHTIQSQRETLDRQHQTITTALERERINEKNVSQLQSTVDRMLNEAKERLRTHTTERKQVMDERTMYNSKIEVFEKDLKVSQERNEEMTDEIEKLKNQLNSLRSSSETSANGVVFRNKNVNSSINANSSSISTNSSKQVRYSWQVTDIDDAMNKSTKDKAKSNPSVENTTSVPREDVGGVGEGEEAEWDVSQLVSMLETQVTKLDMQLESMGENMAEADEFDRVMQSVSDGNYRPSISTGGMEAFPHSNPPLRKKKYHSEALPKAIYRVSMPSSHSPENSPTSTTSNESIPSTNSVTKKSSFRRTSFSKIFRRSKGSGIKKNSSRRSSAPLPQAVREINDDAFARDSIDYSDLLESSYEREEDRKRKEKLLFGTLEQGLPFRKWDSRTLVAWLEVWIGVPFWYIAAIRNCLDSGETLTNISDAELEQELGITNTLHRLKLKLAVQEILSVTTNAKSHRTTSPYGEMAHSWIGDYWLLTLGLSQYKEVFKACLVDARMLEYLNKRDLRTALKMVDSSHRNSLQFGISVLKKLDYNREAFEDRRKAVSVQSRKDVMVWTNNHVMEWVESLGLVTYAPNLKEQGVHGGIIALDNDFDHEKLALALQIPLTDTEVRKQLKSDFLTLLNEGTSRTSTESQSHGKIVRKLSKRLKVGSRTRMTPHHNSDHSEFLQVRSSSPVLIASNPVPLHMQSLMEDERESDSFINTANFASNHDSRLHTSTKLTN